jgi:hypothetical protein
LPRLQTFDGPDLDAVLSRVRTEVGADAKIVSATKARTGGLGGFFSKEIYKVQVEAGVYGPAAAPAAAPSAPMVDFEPLTPPAASILDLADLVDEAEAETARPPEAAPAPAAAPAAPPEPAPVPARARRAVVATVREPAHVPSTERPSFQSVLRRIAGEAGAPGAPIEPLRMTDRAGTLDLLQRRGAVTLARLGVPEAVLPAELSPAAMVIAMLHSLHLPQAAPLPNEAGQVTVIVGERKPATELAYELAAELGIRRAEVRIADPSLEPRRGRLVTPAEARTDAASAKKPRVVALTGDAGSPDLGWTFDMVAALEPAALWGVVTADKKCEDVAAWSSRLGGIDALALHGLDRTVTPAALLQLGIPVARLEGQPATTELWASVLTARLAA